MQGLQNTVLSCLGPPRISHMPEVKNILYRVLRFCIISTFLPSLLLLYQEREINGVLAKELAGQKRATESVTQA